MSELTSQAAVSTANEMPEPRQRPSVRSVSPVLCDRVLSRLWLAALEQLDLSKMIPCAIELGAHASCRRYFICTPPSVREQRKVAEGAQIRLRFACTMQAALERLGWAELGKPIDVDGMMVRIWGEEPSILTIDWSTGSLELDRLATPPVGLDVPVVDSHSR